MTPAELLALADAATPGPWWWDKKWKVHAPQRGRISPWLVAELHNAQFDGRLIALAPDLARLCAEMGEALEEIAKERFGVMPDGSTPSSFASAALAKLSELEAR